MVLFLLDVKKAFYQPVPEGRLNWVSTSVCVGVCVCVCVFLCVSLFVSLYRSICVLLCVTLSESRCEFLYNVGEWRLTIDSSDVTYRRTTVGEAGWFIAAMVWVPLCFSSCLSGCPCVCVCVFVLSWGERSLSLCFILSFAHSCPSLFFQCHSVFGLFFLCFWVSRTVRGLFLCVFVGGVWSACVVFEFLLFVYVCVSLIQRLFA